MHLTHYVGWTLSTDLASADESIIGRRERAAGDVDAGRRT